MVKRVANEVLIFAADGCYGFGFGFVLIRF